MVEKYALPPLMAASLRVPPIQYPGDVVPGAVLSKFTGKKEGDTHIKEAVALIERRAIK